MVYSHLCFVHLGAMMTETSDGDGLMDIREAADGADGGLQSWAGWEWKSFCRADHDPEKSQLGSWGACKTGYGPVWQDQAPDVVFQSDNARTYATAVAGDIVKMSFDASYGDFELQYDIKEGIDAQEATEIFAWPQRYPGGAKIEAKATTGTVRVEYEVGNSTVRVFPGEGLTPRARVTVSIKAADGPAPAPPGSPCEYVIPFNFSATTDAQTQMPDGDTIVLTVAPRNDTSGNATSGNSTVQIVLENDADTWWKAVTQHRHNKFVREIASTQDSRKVASGVIQMEDLANGDQFVLSKAKFAGAHTNVYCIKHARDMNPGMVYTFTWKVCS